MTDAIGFTDAELLAELPRVRRYALALTRNHEAAEDLEQDTMMRALAKRHLFQRGTDLRAWLFTICHNTHVNAVRAATRVELVELTEDNGGSRPAPVMARLIARDVAMTMRGMDAGVRTLIGLAGQGLNYDQIADRLNLPIGTVRSRLSRARAILAGAA